MTSRDRLSSLCVLALFSLLLVSSPQLVSANHNGNGNRFLGTSSSSSSATAPPSLCRCLCCLQGQCVAVPNISWEVPNDCASSCTRDQCLARMQQEDEKRWASSSHGTLSRLKRPACLILRSSEDALCAGQSHEVCQRHTTVRSQCRTRTSKFHDGCCMLWVAIGVGLLGLALYRKCFPRAAMAAAPAMTTAVPAASTTASE